MNHEQSLVDHLTELRGRLIQSVAGLICASLFCYLWSEQLFEVIRKPITPYLPSSGLVFTAPMDKFLSHVQIAIFAGTILSCPFWLYQVWKFVAPGLYNNERKYALGFISTGASLFISGVLLCYFLILPVTFEFLMNFGGSVDKPMITISEYLSFFITMNLVFGVAFELPLVLVILGMMGVVSKGFLVDKRRYAIVLIAIFAAIATPSPDAISMLLLMAPMAVLYEVAVILVGFFEKTAKASASR
jgi:sec-independent protein translocase protein TatC